MARANVCIVMGLCVGVAYQLGRATSGHSVRASAQCSVMEWWQTLITALVPLGLVQTFTTVRDARRLRHESAERETERAHQLSMAELERKHAVADAWREERRAVHAEAHAAFRAYRQALTAYVDSAPSGKLKVTKEQAEELVAVTNRAGMAMSALRLVASTEASNAADEALRSLNELHAICLMVDVAPIDNLRDVQRDAADLIQRYLGRARRELETL